MIKIHMNQKEVLDQIRQGSTEHEISDLVMELVSQMGIEFSLSLITRLQKGVKHDQQSTMATNR